MSLGGVQNTEGTNAGEIFVQFNQDATSLVAGSPSGYHLFALSADDGLEEIYASNTGQEVCLVDRLFSSSLVAIVTVSAPRKLIVCHYKKGTEICNYSYSNTILAVKLNRSRLVVCLEESLHIHNIRDMKVLHTIRDTPPNPRGLIALAAGDRALLAYPGSARTGELQVFDTAALGARCVLAAHEAPLAALAWSRCGRRLATASERGTVIRVFLIPERLKLYELRRGLARHVSIAALAWSAGADLLAAASNTETVHIFKLDDADKQPAGGEAEAAGGGGAAGEDGSWLGGWLAAAVAAGGRLLPAHVASVLTQERAAATARLPAPRPARLAIALTSGAGGTRLLAATGGGALLVYGVDTRDGGVCPLRATHSLLPRRAPPPAHAGGSYAGKLRGAVDADEERAEELSAAMEGSPPRALPLRDPAHFPPIAPARKH